MIGMRELEINKRKIHYALYQGYTDTVDSNGYKTGEKTKTYADPVPFRINVSPARGNADREIFGIDCNYTKTMTTADINCPIQEDTLLWIDVDASDQPDYVVVRKAVSLNDIVYAIREVTVSG